MAALFCSSSSNKLPNYIDLTGSDEDDDDVQVLLKSPVTDPHADPHAPPKLPVEFSAAIQDTLLEAARESTRRLATGHTLATVPGHGSSKKIPSISSKKPNTSSLVAGSPHRAANQRPPLPSSTNAIMHPPSPPRAASKPIGPALARVQTTIEGLFHRSGRSSEGQSSINRHNNGPGAIGEIREGITLKKRHIAREGGDELGLIEQINQSSLTNEEKAILVKHSKHSGDSHPSAEGSETEPDASKKAAIYLLRTQLFPYIISIIDLFKDIKTLEERNEIGRETARKVFAKLHFRETPLRSDAPPSKTRDNEIKAFVKAAFDEVIAERERRAAVMDSGVELGGYMQVSSDGAHRELGEAGDIGILDGLSDINMSEPQRQPVDLNKSVTGLVQGRTPPKRTADGVVKASSISKIDGPLSPHQVDGSIVTASAVSLSKGPQSNLRVGPKAVVPSSNMRIYQHTLASELEKHQQASTSATSGGLDASLPLETPIRSYIVRLYVGRARLLKFISEQPSSRLAKPPSKRRSTDLRTRRQPTKLQTTRSKLGPSFPKGKSNPPMATKDTPNSPVFAANIPHICSSNQSLAI
ncbi:MAG: hypothetical protein M1839_005315 [Geoglossum umbratile]|nr:MAG: hypothetical protein M1839_005315 [Geoglossum umbratile]